ncbi:MAG: polyphosphate polymerase domain-containing protein [SAR324 cluster bacterium]|nr:polyphosphate polymerase domain-containing protein [SAR324 cluster bacterium]
MTNRDTNNYRFERKFIIPRQATHSIEEVVKNNSALMSEVFYPRYVNNIYFDNPRFQIFHENIDGVSERIKARIRWYGDLEGRIEKPVLEFKQKHGLTGSKTSFVLSSFDLSDIYQPGFLDSLFKESNLDQKRKELMLSLKPTLINRYQRKYFLSFNQRFRITLDHKLQYFPVHSTGQLSQRGFDDEVSMILELKYDSEFQSESIAITQEFPFRVIKNSKYVRGVQTLYDLGHYM